MESLLPAEIKLDIFSRLPAESVLQCRQVCKTWRTLLHHPHFADMHLRQSLQPGRVGILYLHGKYDGLEKQLYYGEYDETDEQAYKTLKRINHPPVKIRGEVFESCNGLICLSVKNNDDLDHSIYICNPITREYINLPVFNIDISKERYVIHGIVYGLGYLPSTNEYKVVGILNCHDRKKGQSSKWVAGSVQVYTLGSGTGWRKKGEFIDLSSGYCVLANGSLNFLDDDESKIMAFDLAAEEFRLLPSPPCFVRRPEDYLFFLRVFGGLLCLVHEKRDKSIDIWSLKNKDCTAYVMKEQDYMSWSWHRELSMSLEGRDAQDPDVFAITGNSEVLLWLNLGIRSDMHKHSILSRYDPKTLGEDAKIIQSAEGLLELEMSKCNRGVEHSSSTPY